VVPAAGREGADGVWASQLQEALSLVPARCACGLEGKPSLLSTVLGIAFVAARYANLYGLYGLQDRRSRRHLIPSEDQLLRKEDEQRKIAHVQLM
jgi:hypothetical protein